MEQDEVVLKLRTFGFEELRAARRPGNARVVMTAMDLLAMPVDVEGARVYRSIHVVVDGDGTQRVELSMSRHDDSVEGCELYPFYT